MKVYSEKKQLLSPLKPNAFGLYDMAGNVWEWVSDCPHDYSQAPVDGKAWNPQNCQTRVLRGGSWSNYAKYLRSAYRIWDDPDIRDDSIGFRLAQDLP